MKKKVKEPLLQVAARIEKQCACDVLTTIAPVCQEWGITFLNGFLLFTEEVAPFLIIPLSNIYGTLVTDNDLYILCNNRVCHHFKRQTRLHEVIFLDDTDEDLFCRFMN